MLSTPQLSLLKRPTPNAAKQIINLKMSYRHVLTPNTSPRAPRITLNIISVSLAVAFAVFFFLGSTPGYAQSFNIEPTSECVERVTKQSPRFSDYSVLNCVGLSAFACAMTPGGDTTVGMIDCYRHELDYWEARLATAYAQRREAAQKNDEEMAKLNATVDSVTETLTAMQTAWYTYREASCRYEQSLWFGGTGGGPATMACYVHLTAQQSLRLEGWWEQ